jgi:hypothetical protein
MLVKALGGGGLSSEYELRDGSSDQRESRAFRYDAEGNLIGAWYFSEDPRYCDEQSTEVQYGDFEWCEGERNVECADFDESVCE